MKLRIKVQLGSFALLASLEVKNLDHFGNLDPKSDYHNMVFEVESNGENKALRLLLL